jgi:3',5'-cyclic AMP phosphodiesterase CpdA
MPQTVGLLYDPHIIAGGRRSNDGVATTKAAIAKLNEVGVDWTVIGGDLVNLTTPVAGHVEWGDWHDDPDNYYYRDDFRRAKELFDQYLDSTYHVSRGNVDRPLSVYREFFPESDFPQWQWFTEDGARYVLLDSSPHEGYHPLTETQAFVSAPQLSMLERLMDQDPEIPTFVFIHAPLASHDELEDGWDTGFQGAYYRTNNYLSVQDILERGNTIFVNSGHYYNASTRGSVEVNGVEYVIGRHLTKNHDADWQGGDVRWLEVDVADQSAAVRYYDVANEEEGTITETTW